MGSASISSARGIHHARKQRRSQGPIARRRGPRESLRLGIRCRQISGLGQDGDVRRSRPSSTDSRIDDGGRVGPYRNAPIARLSLPSNNRPGTALLARRSDTPNRCKVGTSLACTPSSAFFAVAPRISARPWVVAPISGTPFEQFERPAPTHDTSPLTTTALPPTLEIGWRLTPQGCPSVCYPPLHMTGNDESQCNTSPKTQLLCLPPSPRWKRNQAGQPECSALSKLSQLRELHECRAFSYENIAADTNTLQPQLQKCPSLHSAPASPATPPMSHSARSCADTNMSQMSQRTDTKTIFPDTNGVTSGAPAPVSRHNSQATDRSAEIQLTPSAVIGRVARASPAWGEEFYAHG